MEGPIVPPPRQVEPLLTAQPAGRGRATTSLDLGLTDTEVAPAPDRVRLPGEQWLSWAGVAGIAAHDEVCFAVGEASGAERIGRF